MPAPTFDPVTNPDVQEALSRRYGNAGLYVLPLSSGNLAIFGRDMQLIQITNSDDWPIKIIGETSRTADLRLSTAAAARFYGEPDDKSLGRDLRRSRRVPNMSQPTIEDLALDI